MKGISAFRKEVVDLMKIVKATLLVQMKLKRTPRLSHSTMLDPNKKSREWLLRSYGPRHVPLARLDIRSTDKATSNGSMIGASN